MKHEKHTIMSRKHHPFIAAFFCLFVASCIGQGNSTAEKERQLLEQEMELLRKEKAIAEKEKLMLQEENRQIRNKKAEKEVGEQSATFSQTNAQGQNQVQPLQLSFEDFYPILHADFDDMGYPFSDKDRKEVYKDIYNELLEEYDSEETFFAKKYKLIKYHYGPWGANYVFYKLVVADFTTGKPYFPKHSVIIDKTNIDYSKNSNVITLRNWDMVNGEDVREQYIWENNRLIER